MNSLGLGRKPDIKKMEKVQIKNLIFRENTKVSTDTLR